MRKCFNTEGLCIPDIHYMVHLDERVKQIKEKYVDQGSYFVINRGRQYGKTTTLNALAEYLRGDYVVIHMDFQGIGTENYRNETAFSVAFLDMFLEECRTQMQDSLLLSLRELKQSSALDLRTLFTAISDLCTNSPRKMVLLIDEVDSASNNQVFLDFLAQMRKGYLERMQRATFHSVVLAGVYDIKNLKLKFRSDEEHQYNSPWNIAARFKIDMGFDAAQIASMLQEYEADHHTGMDVCSLAEEIYRYTSGYPYLVSALCKLLDEDVSELHSNMDEAWIWSKQGVLEAVKLLLKEEIPLFGSMAKQLQTYPQLSLMIEDIVYQGARIPYSPSVFEINLGMMFGFLKEQEGQVQISNRIFEMYLLNMFAVREAVTSEAFRCGQLDRNQFISGGRLDMDRVLERFILHYSDIYGSNDDKFIEKYGRKLFLLYLKPIINGTGNYYLEAQTRDERRTDVIIDYLGEQFIIELKIWHGNEYNERGEQQLVDYLDRYHQTKGYMLSFNFNHNKKVGMRTITRNGKTIVEAVV